jgi:hypothetical protein
MLYELLYGLSEEPALNCAVFTGPKSSQIASLNMA